MEPPGLVIAPRPIRLGEPGYWDHLNDLYSRIGRSSDEEDSDSDSSLSNTSIQRHVTTEGQLHLNLAPTLPTYTECLYTLDGHQRTRLPCECFNSLPPTKCSVSQPSVIRSEFEQDDRLSTTNLIDWQTKESWICDTVRDHVYREMNQSNRWIRLYSSTDFRSTTTTRHQDSMDTDLFDDEAKAWSSPTSSSSNAIGRYNRSPATTVAYSEDSNSGFTITQRSSESPIFYERSLLSPPLSPTIALPRRTNRNDTKIFKCDQSDCCKRFSRKEELTRHKKTHCSERPFQCEICKRKFNRKDHMTKHQATHQDVSTRRRYLCPSPGCDRCYTRSDALSRHRSSAHSLAHEPGLTAFVHRRR